MRILYPVALAALVVSCHLEKLLNSGGNPPPSEAAPARVAFSHFPGNARAGQPISPPVQVTVQDSAGRVTLRDTLVTLSLGANPSSDTLRGIKQVRSVNGVATFAELRLDKAASGYTLTAAAPNLHPDTSAAFSVMPAPATQLLFTVQPSSAMPDSAIKPPVQVSAYDSLGNEASFTGVIALALGTNAAGGTLSGGAPVNAVNGVATFPNLSVDKPGYGYTLRATASGLTDATSNAFNVTTSPPTTGDLTVTTSTSGPNPPSAYTVTVDGAQSRSLGLNTSTTYTGLTATSHSVQLNGIPANCSVSEANPETVTVPAGGTAQATFTVTCTALPPPTGDLTVTTATSGPNPPSGYTVTVDGGQSRSLGLNASTTYTGLTATSHTVQLNGIPTNCSVSEANPQTVTVPAGGTAQASFTITCAALTGDLTVSTSTSGPDQPNGYTVSVTGGGSQTIGASGSVTFPGLATGSHTVTLSGVPSTCSVTGGTSQTVTVTAGGTATAAFTITCTALTGSVTVSTTTSGPNQPSGYTVAVSGASSQAIGTNTTVTFSNLVAGSHTVTLSGIASNCSVTSSNPQTVTVPAGGTAQATFTISCTAPNVPPVVNAGPNDNAVTGLLYSFTWSFSDGNHNGPWSYTIDWGDGSTSSGNVSSEGSFSAGHTYIIVLPRSFTITVTVTDASGAPGSDSKVVSVTLL